MCFLKNKINIESKMYCVLLSTKIEFFINIIFSNV